MALILIATDTMGFAFGNIIVDTIVSILWIVGICNSINFFDNLDGGAAGILVTHDAKNAAWADRILLIRDGVIVDEARTKRDLNELMKNV